MHQVLPLGTSPCDATGRLEMKVEFRYVQPVSAFPNASTPFAFSLALCAGKVDPEALGWAGRPNQHSGIGVGDSAGRRLQGTTKRP